MSLFDVLGNQTARQGPGNTPFAAIRRDIGEISSSPGSYLQSRGFSIPDGMTDAKEITQYLLQTGQIKAPRLQQVMQMLGVGRR